ncbi:glycerol kinase GlpK [Spirulina sp. CS-785/01]|uniref:glycerol kinase GlpK n=1 Tax=Spirulina sp. CS-785/01 TaxID=3021716 RepID=UPI0023309C9D|nr:glycerol kinase GlpK [Spirulina sp. CS-785/01]MDB9312505.1 glycerol kinase GlpK [Spirulina sp. CS-785/01]
MASNPQYVMALDVGTTGTRAILFDQNGAMVDQAYKELTQHYPKPGWLEHDPIDIWRDTREMIGDVLVKTDTTASQLAAMGLTVQRETCLLWDKTTGKPLHKAIVWQDRRTSPMCNRLREQGKAEEIQKRTGLVLDAYFSATKLAWLIEEVKNNQPHVNWDNVIAGTVDTWILWQLTGRQVHVTDHSNASRTMLMNIEQRTWDQDLLELFGIPPHFMPEIQPSLGEFGKTHPDLFGHQVPIMAIFGDQQAALFAHGCDRQGLLKCTYGTGCFLVAQTEQELTRSQNQLLSTVAWTKADTINYALEGAMFTTGACIQWLRDGLGLIQSAADTEPMSKSVEDNNGVYFVPALSGLGAPHWDMNARGSFQGITGGVKREHMVRAVVESIAYQVKEVVDAMNKDGDKINLLKVDGGASKNDFLMQFQADVLGIPVERPEVLDATAQGAAFGAGLAVGFWDSYADLIGKRKVDRVFEPGQGQGKAQEHFQVWLRAVERAKHWTED